MALELAPPSNPKSLIKIGTKEDTLIEQLKGINRVDLNQEYRIYYNKSSENKNTDTHNFKYIIITPYLGKGNFDILPLLELLKNVVIDNLEISWCKTTFPDDFFDNVIIKGNLNAVSCSIEKLPESFGTIQCGGTVNLAENNIKSLPNFLDGCNIGCNFILSTNQITKVTATNLKVGGNLILRYNGITTLDLTNFKIGGDLDVSLNGALKKVSFKNVVIGCSVILPSRGIKTFTCENINIGGSFNT